MGGRTGASGFTAKAKGKLQIGNEIIEFDGVLKYGAKDPNLQGDNRKKLEEWENKRRKNKVEYGTVMDKDGEVLEEKKGGKGSVKVPLWYHYKEGSTFTHNHPRENGLLGGSFSPDDLHNFNVGLNKTFRAVAKEGTYSISKTDKFDHLGFEKMVKRVSTESKEKYDKAWEEIYNKLNNKELSYDDFLREGSKAGNNYLLSMHEAYLANQKKYGYTYTLEPIT